MSIESEPKEPSPLFSKLAEMVLPENKIDPITGRKTKFGTVDIQPMGDLNISKGGFIIEYIGIQIQSPEPDNIWTVFKVFRDGRVETKVSEGGFGSPQNIEPAFTLDEILAEIQ